jgi:hypothetical protein
MQKLSLDVKLHKAKILFYLIVYDDDDDDDDMMMMMMMMKHGHGNLIGNYWAICGPKLSALAGD